MSKATVLFMGWFGPRGLASIVLGLVYLAREAELAGNSTIRLAVMATVLLSIFAHGLTAQPGITLYARRIAALDETSPDHQALGDGSPEPPHTPHLSARVRALVPLAAVRHFVRDGVQLEIRPRACSTAAESCSFFGRADRI